MSGSAESSFETAPTLESIPDLIGRLKEEHAAADALCKHVQAFREEAGVPAINEMRYAGYHVTLALPTNGGEWDRAHLLKSISHAQRAVYEAAEAGILTCLDQIALFKNDYRLVAVSDVVNDWIDILTAAAEAQERLRSQRQTGAVRADDHTAHKALFDRLVVICRRLDVARDELNKKMDEKRSGSRRWYIATGLTMIAVVVALISLFIHLPSHEKGDPNRSDAPPPSGKVQPL